MNKDEALLKLQTEELDILLMLDRFCSENDIQYFMDSGTTLGALRHKGFIPWDDDVDVGMLREDYDRFLSLAENGLPTGYSLHTFENTPGFGGLFAKVYRDGTEFSTPETIEAGCDQGIFVDIFPYDMTCDDETAREAQIRNAKKWKYVSYLYHSSDINVPHTGFLGKLEEAGCKFAHLVIRTFIKRESILEHWNRSLVPDPPGKRSGELFVVLSSQLFRVFPRDMLVPPARAEFCDHTLPVPAQPEKYLELVYGDWRKLPSPENRKSHLPQRLRFSDGSTWEA